MFFINKIIILVNVFKCNVESVFLMFLKYQGEMISMQFQNFSSNESISVLQK